MSPMTNLRKRTKDESARFEDIMKMFNSISQEELISDQKNFRRKVITEGGSACIANNCLGWIYAATMENMIAFQTQTTARNDQIISIAAAMFLRMVEYNVAPGQDFQIAKRNDDLVHYDKEYKSIVDRSVMYQDYFKRMERWPDLNFVKE
jgi:hypothetical protein